MPTYTQPQGQGFTQAQSRYLATKYLENFHPCQTEIKQLADNLRNYTNDVESAHALLVHASELLIGNVVSSKRSLRVAAQKITQGIEREKELRNQILVTLRKIDEQSNDELTNMRNRIAQGIAHIHEAVPCLQMAGTEHGITLWLDTLTLINNNGDELEFPGICLNFDVDGTAVCYPNSNSELPLPNYCRNGNYFHPHVYYSDNRICYGDAIHEIKRHTERKEVFEFFSLCFRLLSRYNDESPVQSIDNWTALKCINCDIELGNVGNTRTCTECGIQGCTECLLCCDNGNWVCSEHYGVCEKCEASFRSDHGYMCESCGSTICYSCMVATEWGMFCSNCMETCDACEVNIPHDERIYCESCDSHFCPTCFGNNPRRCVECQCKLDLQGPDAPYDGVPDSRQQELPLDELEEESPTLVALLNQLM